MATELSLATVLGAFGVLASLVGLLIFLFWTQLGKLCHWISEEKNPVFQVCLCFIFLNENCFTYF